MKPSQWIDAADRLKLEAAIQSLRTKTGAEVAIAIVTNSCWNREIPWRIASGFAALTLLSAPLWPSLHDPGVLGVATLAAFAAGFGLGRLPRVQRNLQDSKSVCAKVNAHAQRIFSEAGLARATQKRGILFFVSLLEERVVVLADEGVTLRDPTQSPWPQWSQKIGDGFRAGQPVPSLLAALAKCETLLAPQPASAYASHATSISNTSVLLIDAPEA